MMPSRKSPDVAEMLSEIQSETCAQLICSLLYQTSPSGSTGLPGLDVQLLSSAATRASPSSSFNRGDVLEIQGAAASGKTQLVYYLTMQCILPNKTMDETFPSEVDIGGWGRGAVILDTDGRFNVQRLKSLLIKRVQKSSPARHTEFQGFVQDVVEESLQRLHVFRVKSSASLAATLFQLPLYHSVHMPEAEIALLVVDSISSFYWVDRYRLEHQHQQRSSSAERRAAVNPLSRILVALQEIRLNHGPVTVLTNWGLSPVTNVPNGGVAAGASSPFYRQHLHPFPAPFESPPRIPPDAHLMPPITHHITLSPPSTTKLSPEATSLQAALEKTEVELADRRRGEFRGTLRIVETHSTAIFTVETFEETKLL